MIAGNINGQFGNWLFKISAIVYLANKYNIDYKLIIPNNYVWRPETKELININNLYGYQSILKKFKNNIFYELENIDMFEEINKNNIGNIFKVISHKNCFLKGSIINFGLFNYDRNFVKNLFDFLYNKNKLNELDSLIPINIINKSNVLHFRLLPKIYREKYENFFKYNFQNILNENKYNIIIGDDLNILHKKIKEYHIILKNCIIFSNKDFIYDFMIMMNCKQIYSFTGSTFSRFAAFLGNIKLIDIKKLN